MNKISIEKELFGGDKPFFDAVESRREGITQLFY